MVSLSPLGDVRVLILATLCHQLCKCVVVVTCSVADHVVFSSAHDTKDQSASIAILMLCVVTSVAAITGQSLT